MMDRELIYQMRYEDILKDDDLDDIPEEVGKDDDLTGEEFLREIMNMKYELKEGAEEHAKECIRLAKELSEAYRLDIDIFREKGSVEIYLYMNAVPLVTFQKEMFLALAQACDSMTIWPKGEGFSYEVQMSYYTHDAYFRGKKMPRF